MRSVVFLGVLLVQSVMVLLHRVEDHRNGLGRCRRLFSAAAGECQAERNEEHDQRNYSLLHQVPPDLKELLNGQSPIETSLIRSLHLLACGRQLPAATS